MGFSGPAFPFDWLRTSLGSVLRAITTNFEGFLDYRAALPQYERPRVLSEEEIAADDYTPFEVIYACDGHALWHSICWDDRDLASCQRRAQRLMRLAENEIPEPVLFVRAASSGKELEHVSEALEVLAQQLSPRAHLLLMLSGQPSHRMLFVADQPRLMIATLGSDCNEAEEYLGVLPLYHDAIWDAIWYLQQGTRPPNQLEVPSLGLLAGGSLSTLVDPQVDLGEDTTGHWCPDPGAGPGEVRGAATAALRGSTCGRAASLGRGSVLPAVLERSSAGRTAGNASRGFRRIRRDTRGVRAVSLGGWCGVKAAINELGFQKDNLPFDWIRSSLEGVLHALRSDFSDFLKCEAVIERHGRYGCPAQSDILQRLRPTPAATQPLPLAPPRHEHVYLAAGHSFWYDDLACAGEQAKYERRIQRLRRLRPCGRAACAEARGIAGAPDAALRLLFVRAVNATAELLAVDALHDLLSAQFGQDRAYLLVLVDKQPSQCMLLFDDRPTLLVHTLALSGAAQPSAFLPLYTRAISAGLDVVLSGARPSGHVLLPSLDSLYADAHGRLLADVDLGSDLTKQWGDEGATVMASLQDGEDHVVDANMLYEPVE